MYTYELWVTSTTKGGVRIRSYVGEYDSPAAAIQAAALLKQQRDYTDYRVVLADQETGEFAAPALVFA